MKKLLIQTLIPFLAASASANELYCDHLTRVETKHLEVHFADDLGQVQVGFDHSKDPASDLNYTGVMNQEESLAETLVYDLSTDTGGTGKLTVKKTAVSFPKPDCPRCFVAPNYKFSAVLQTLTGQHQFSFCSGQPF